MRPVLSIIAASASLFVAASAAAEGVQTSFSGFGTLGVVKSDNPSGDFVVPLQPSGARKGHVDAGPDTKLGVQGTVQVGDTWSATAQAVVRHTYRQWRPEVVLAFGKARLPAGFAVRAGRIGGPYFVVSDYRLIDYSNLWLRPPVDVYGQVPFQSVDGADVLWEGTVGGAAVHAQAFYGKAVDVLANAKGTTVGVTGPGVNVSIEAGAWTVRLGYAQGHLNIRNANDFDLLLGGLRAVSAMPGLGAAAQLADELSIADKFASFGGVGLTYDKDHLIASAEWTRRRVDGFYADTTGWYATGGWRVGSWTPYVTVSQLRQDSRTSTDVLPRVGPLVPLVDGVNALLASVGQRTKSVGVRWDVARNLAIKAQFDHLRLDQGGQGLLDEPVVGANSQRPVRVLSLAASFVF